MRRLAGVRSLRASSRPFLAMLALLVVVFLTGGGSRGDVASLMVLRPLSVLLLGYGCSTLRWADVSAHRFLFGMAGAIALLPILHLVPLPPSLWTLLPGREAIAEVDRAAGLGAVWRPLSMAPDMTWNALFATAVPLAALVIGVQLGADDRRRLLGPILVLGALDALLGVAQMAGNPQGRLYFYEITNPGSAVGLFANRNHQAMFTACLLPMLAVWSGQGRSRHGARAGVRGPIALALALCLLPLIMLTGSRLGLIAGAMAILLTPALFIGRPRAEKLAADRRAAARSGSGKFRSGRARGDGSRASRPTVRWGDLSGVRLPLPVVLALGAAVVALSVWLGRDLALERLTGVSLAGDLRIQALPTVLSMIGDYLPFGSGVGSFEQAYRLHEPDALLSSVYLNHAHNDWLEALQMAGIPAALLIAAGIAGFAARAWRLYAGKPAPVPDLYLARLGLVIVLLIAVSSLADYPLRVPSIDVFFIVALLWATQPAVPASLAGEEPA